MQTFLAYPDYEKSVKILDNSRLIKQCVETQQILNAIINKSGWKFHPASRMFKNNTNSLVNYGLAACVEVKNRGFKWQKNYEKIISFYDETKSDDSPDWLGDQKVHNSHKSRLLCKGEIDRLCLAIKKHLKIRSINAWLKNNPLFKKEKNYLKFSDIKLLNDFIEQNKIDLSDFKNFYKQYDWNVSMEREYVWPN